MVRNVELINGQRPLSVDLQAQAKQSGELQVQGGGSPQPITNLPVVGHPCGHGCLQFALER